MTDKITPNTLMTALRSELKSLSEMVKECAVDCRVFELPLYIDKVVPDEINPKVTGGNSATLIAADALTNLSRLKEQHPASVLRTPGVVIVDRNLTTLVANVNKLKNSLKKQISDRYPDPKARRLYTQSTFEGRMMLQVYRHIYTNTVIEKTKTKPQEIRIPKSVRYTWSPYTFTSKPLNRKQAELLLIERRESKIDNYSENRAKALDYAINLVRESHKDQEFTIRKDRPPFPKANIFYGPQDIVDVPASLPLLIYQPNPSEPIEIRDLSTYKKSKRNNPRSDLMDTEIIFKPLYLHVKN